MSANVQIPLFDRPRKTTPKIPLRDRVLQAIAELGPITDEALVRRLRLPANSVRPRRVELAALGAIVRAGVERRDGRRGATLWAVPRDVEGSR